MGLVAFEFSDVEVDSKLDIERDLRRVRALSTRSGVVRDMTPRVKCSCLCK